MVCPSCQRPVAVARPRCLYCGAVLPTDAAKPPEAPPAGPPREGRMLLFLDLEGADAARLAEALRLTPFDARQRARRGGVDLWRSLPAAEAAAEAERLQAHRLSTLTIPEEEVRAALRPRIATGGRIEGATLVARTSEGPLKIESPDVLLRVVGEITREYAPTAAGRRARTATLEPGHRIHLHLRSSSAALEIDPGAFDFGDALLGRSSLLTLTDWLGVVAPGVPLDDGFRRESPAMSLSADDESGPAGAARVLSAQARVRAGRRERPAILDNLAQFRFYSACRGALERRRGGGGAG